MSEDLLATVLTIGIIIAIVAWVPALNLICTPCSRFLERRRRRLPVAQRTAYTANKTAA